MANFLQQNKSPFAPIQSYTPDWGFLSTVMGVKQAEYDKGFNIVKSQIDALKYSDLSNPENEKHRDYLFKQLNTSLNSLSNLDLSKGENISRALKMLNPISQDKELLYDWQLTKKLNEQLARAESFKNSNDLEKRKMYNKYSEMDINYAKMRLSEASRGDGSIFEIKPVTYVPYQDYIEALDKKMIDLDIEYKVSYADGEGYFIQTTNGKMSIPAFIDFAHTHLGPEFQEQFDVIGRVQAESAIRSVMSNMGVSRRDAETIVAKKMIGAVQKSETYKGNEYLKDLEEAQKQLNILRYTKQTYPDKIKNVEAKEAELVNTIAKLKNNIENTEAEIVSSNDINYVVSNLANIFSNNYRNGVVTDWAISTANVTYKYEEKPDNTWAVKYREANELYRFNKRLEFDKKKAKYDNYFKAQYLGLKQKEANQRELENLGIEGYSVTGSYTSPKEIYKVISLNNQLNTAQDNAYNVAFGDTDSLMSLLLQVNNSNGSILKDLSKYQRALNMLKNYSSSDNDKQLLSVLHDMNNKLGLGMENELAQISDIGNKAVAQQILNLYALGIYNATKDVLARDGSNNIAKDRHEQLSSLSNSLRNSLYIMEEVGDWWDGVLNGMISKLEESGLTEKDIIGYTNKGTPIYDISKMEEYNKNLLSQPLPDYLVHGVPTTEMHTFRLNENSTILSILLNPDNWDQLSIEGTSNFKGKDAKDIKEIYSGLANNVLNKHFGNEINVAYDPSTNDYVFELKRGEYKKTGIGNLDAIKQGSLKFRMSKDVVNKNATLRNAIGWVADNANTPTNAVGGEYRKLLNGDIPYIKYDDLLGNGFKATVSINPNTNKLQTEFGFKNIESNGWESVLSDTEFEITNEGILGVEDLISNVQNTYFNLPEY